VPALPERTEYLAREGQVVADSSGSGVWGKGRTGGSPPGQGADRWCVLAGGWVYFPAVPVDHSAVPDAL
jgi:hypothetical protein